jgi:GT2 family glycosyltransferase
MVADLCVVLVNWRNETRTLRCVSAIRQWRGVNPALLVVDNQSTRESRARLGAALGAEELICSEANLGFAGGNNLALARALPMDIPFILLLNSDAVLSEDGLAALLERMKADPHIGVLGPLLREQRDGVTRSYAGGRNIAAHAFTRRAVEPQDIARRAGALLIDADYVPGTVMLVRRSLFGELGLLDERFFFSGEIADFCKRARDRGYRVCIDLAVEAQHDVDDTPLRDTLYVYYSLRNRRLFAKKHHRSARVRYLLRWLGLCVAEFGKAIAQGRLGKARAILLALLHGCTNRFGDRNAAFL